MQCYNLRGPSKTNRILIFYFLGTEQKESVLPQPEDVAVTEEPAINSVVSLSSDHSYVCRFHWSADLTCAGCQEKDESIKQLSRELDGLKLSSESQDSKLPNKSNIISCPCIDSNEPVIQSVQGFEEQYILNDKRVRLNTGLPSKAAFEDLLKVVSPRATRMRYWAGARSVLSTKVPRKFVKTPTKSGPKRSLSVRAELVMVLMKLRLALSNEFLAMSFKISAGTCSVIFSTWIKLLSHVLKNLVYWPEKSVVQKLLPRQFAGSYQNLRCTIDCSETFIERPRDLKMQAVTWSDYKHHNTLKYLVAISPNGTISFISKCWGGRTSDRHIVQNSGFLDLIDPKDLVMADRGFTIQEDLLYKQASLLIPPSSSGKTQMCRENVLKTKKVANARIHVERAINRLKWFKIVSSTLPLTMVHMFDDILVVCAALCNLLPPLVL